MGGGGQAKTSLRNCADSGHVVVETALRGSTQSDVVVVVGVDIVVVDSGESAAEVVVVVSTGEQGRIAGKDGIVHIQIPVDVVVVAAQEVVEVVVVVSVEVGSHIAVHVSIGVGVVVGIHAA